MRRRRRASIEDLRSAIAQLPRRTRVAMLQGIEANDIIVGAYSTRDGICPMLAAHRAGGRTALIAFAEAWDAVAFRGQRRTRARRATPRELLILRAHLEASLIDDEAVAGERGAARTGRAARQAGRAAIRPGRAARQPRPLRRPAARASGPAGRAWFAATTSTSAFWTRSGPRPSPTSSPTGCRLSGSPRGAEATS